MSLNASSVEESKKMLSKFVSDGVKGIENEYEVNIIGNSVLISFNFLETSTSVIVGKDENTITFRGSVPLYQPIEQQQKGISVVRTLAAHLCSGLSGISDDKYKECLFGETVEADDIIYSMKYSIKNQELRNDSHWR